MQKRRRPMSPALVLLVLLMVSASLTGAAAAVRPVPERVEVTVINGVRYQTVTSRRFEVVPLEPWVIGTQQGARGCGRGFGGSSTAFHLGPFHFVTSRLTTWTPRGPGRGIPE